MVNRNAPKKKSSALLRFFFAMLCLLSLLMLLLVYLLTSPTLGGDGGGGGVAGGRDRDLRTGKLASDFEQALLDKHRKHREGKDLWTVNMKVETDGVYGDIEIEIHPEWAPQGAQRFKELVEDNYFTNCKFFRAIKNFMVQFGMHPDPKVCPMSW
jgi:hypothetical protein